MNHAGYRRAAAALAVLAALVCCGLAGCAVFEKPGAKDFSSDWPSESQRVWIGPDYWANRLQDWRLSEGRLECLFRGPNRTVHILTRELAAGAGDMAMSVNLTLDPPHDGKRPPCWAGFVIGAKGEFDDYRDSAIYGKGLHAGITDKGELFIGIAPGFSDASQEASVKAAGDADAAAGVDDDSGNVSALIPEIAAPLAAGTVILRVELNRSEGKSALTLIATESVTGAELGRISRAGVDAEDLTGNLALVCHAKKRGGMQEEPCAWFRDWKIAGSKIAHHPERAFGPVLFAQYTLSKGVLKLTAQMPPVGKEDGDIVMLQVRDEHGDWATIAEAQIDAMARTATFRMADWDASRDHAYRLAYTMMDVGGVPAEHFYSGTIRRDPLSKNEIVVAAFTGNADLGFPNNELVRHVEHHDPDLLFFSGDQIYESVGGYGCQRAPVDQATLDYLRKWYLLGWVFGDMMREVPMVAIPDDHDVYHGNLWGAGGKAVTPGTGGAEAQDSGGYKMPPEWVCMVERTQTSHLPDPFDPTPVEQGIGVYYTDLVWGGVSFAILEDRKFKSPPKVLVPKAEILNGWPKNPDYDAATEGDVPGAKLLGARQLEFLDHWAGDWSHGVWMKAALSQTIFTNIATIPKGAANGSVIPRLPIPKPGEYPPDDYPVSDHDSNGWPQTGRNAAVSVLRKCFAVHIAGDQHLGTTVQYGVDDWGDAGYAICVPSISNFWPRRWLPAEGGRNRKPDAPKYTGEFRDGFGNIMTVHAVANPVLTGLKPSRLHDRAAGYGIVRFRRGDRSFSLENWPRFTDPGAPGAEPYAGWPVTAKQLDNYGREVFGYLPKIIVEGMTDPVVEVADQRTGEMLYTLRIAGTEFQPFVFGDGSYRVTVCDPDRGPAHILINLKPGIADMQEPISVAF